MNAAIGYDVDAWLDHFASMIDGDIIPDEHNDLFLMNRNPTVAENQQKNLKNKEDTKQTVTLVSSVARDLDTAKSDIKEDSKGLQPTDSDPITHFPAQQLETATTTVTTPSKASTKRASKKKNSKTVTKSKKKKVSLWQKY
jgi:hypothetical protein